MSPFLTDPPSRDEVIDVLRAIVNRWSGDYHCCPDNKRSATHTPGCPLVAGLLLLARIGQSGHTFPPQGDPPAHETPEIGGSQTDIRPLPDKSGRSVDGRRMCVEGNAWFCGGSAKYGCAAEGCRAPEAPAVKTGYSCYWFARRDRDYFCDQGEGHQTPHHNVNVPDGATWIDWPPDGVWLDSDGIPGPPVAKKP